MNLKTVTIKDLKPHPQNPNTHPAKQISALGESLDEFDQVKNVVIWNGTILAGHGVIEAAIKSGRLTLDAVDVSHWPEGKATAYMLADIRTPGMAIVDDEALVEALRAMDAPLNIPGFDEDFLKGLPGFEPTPPPEPPAPPDISKADELREVWGTELGQLWALGEHRLAVGDCTDRAVVEGVMRGEKADMMFTDPPYGVGYTGGHFHSGNVNIKRERPKLANDQNSEIYARFLPIIVPFVDGPCYVWFASSVGKPVYNAIIDNGCEIHAMIIWNKINATYAAINAQYKQRHEPCMYFKPKGSTLRWCGPTDECTIWDEKRDPQNEYHPTQKPIVLPLRALKNHKANLILDPFLGSGTTLIAAHQLNRRCRGIEIDSGYAAVTLQRFLDLTSIHPELIK